MILRSHKAHPLFNGRSEIRSTSDVVCKRENCYGAHASTRPCRKACAAGAPCKEGRCYCGSTTIHVKRGVAIAVDSTNSSRTWRRRLAPAVAALTKGVQGSFWLGGRRGRNGALKGSPGNGNTGSINMKPTRGRARHSLILCQAERSGGNAGMVTGKDPEEGLRREGCGKSSARPSELVIGASSPHLIKRRCNLPGAIQTTLLTDCRYAGQTGACVYAWRRGTACEPKWHLSHAQEPLVNSILSQHSLQAVRMGAEKRSPAAPSTACKASLPRQQVGRHSVKSTLCAKQNLYAPGLFAQGDVRCGVEHGRRLPEGTSCTLGARRHGWSSRQNQQVDSGRKVVYTQARP